MNRSRRPRVVSLFLCGLICLATLFATVSGSFAKSAAVGANQAATVTAPSLTLLPYAADEDVLTVRGQGFTPEGKVYLALYDQLGKQLYETRWVTATARATYDAGARGAFDSSIVVHSPGGELVAKFTGLCGASALIRALDDATERWTAFRVVRPLCGSTAGPTIANGLLRPDSFSNSGPNPAGATIAGTYIPAPRPVLIKASQTSVEGSIVVSGQNFTAGGRVYVAIYDRMGAQLYETRWAEATPAFAITGAWAEVPEAHPITDSSGGVLSETFGGLCGAEVLIRAYDQQMEIWSSWLEAAPLCDLAPLGYGPH